MIKDDISYWTHAIAGIVIAGVIWMLVPTSCKTTNNGIGRDVQQSAEQLGELREQNRQLTERIEREQGLYQQLRDSLSVAEGNAQSAGDDIRGAIKLLTEYKRIVGEYIAGLDKSARETKSSP